MQKEMTFIEITNLYEAIEKASQAKFKASPKFRYALAKNKNTLTPLITSLREAAKLPEDDDEIKEYETIRSLIIQEMTNGTGTLPREKADEFNARLKTLQMEHKNAWDKIEKHSKEVNEFILTSQKVDIYMVDISLIPEDIDDQTSINGLFSMFIDKGEDSVK